MLTIPNLLIIKRLVTVITIPYVSKFNPTAIIISVF